jgi:hypothetical protein
MRIAIMQPYYYPYAGYFRLFAATDLFVIYDCVQWNRQGRVHRFDFDGKKIKLPIKRTDRDTTMIKDLQWQCGKEKSITPVEFIIQSMEAVCSELKLHFNTVRSSELPIDHSLKAQNKILAICKHLNATEYVNSPAGINLYDEKTFTHSGIKLTFLPGYKASHDSILKRLEMERAEYVREEIFNNL